MSVVGGGCQEAAPSRPGGEFRAGMDCCRSVQFPLWVVSTLTLRMMSLRNIPVSVCGPELSFLLGRHPGVGLLDLGVNISLCIRPRSEQLCSTPAEGVGCPRSVPVLAVVSLFAFSHCWVRC